MNGKKVIDKLRAAGWTLAHINGSHHVMEKNGMPRSVPVHGSKDIGASLLAELQRQTGVKLK